MPIKFCYMCGWINIWVSSILGRESYQNMHKTTFSSYSFKFGSFSYGNLIRQLVKFLNLPRLRLKMQEMFLSGYITDSGVLSDSGKDIKTEADKAAEEIVFGALQSTDYAILSEESGLSNTDKKFSTICESSLPIWIIDPLDGTYNFTRGIPMCCVSIALWQNPVPRSNLRFRI